MYSRPPCIAEVRVGVYVRPFEKMKAAEKVLKAENSKLADQKSKTEIENKNLKNQNKQLIDQAVKFRHQIANLKNEIKGLSKKVKNLNDQSAGTTGNAKQNAIAMEPMSTVEQNFSFNNFIQNGQNQIENRNMNGGQVFGMMPQYQMGPWVPLNQYFG